MEVGPVEGRVVLGDEIRDDAFTDVRGAPTEVGAIEDYAFDWEPGWHGLLGELAMVIEAIEHVLGPGDEDDLAVSFEDVHARTKEIGEVIESVIGAMTRGRQGNQFIPPLKLEPLNNPLPVHATCPIGNSKGITYSQNVNYKYFSGFDNSSGANAKPHNG